MIKQISLYDFLYMMGRGGGVGLYGIFKNINNIKFIFICKIFIISKN